VTTKVRWLYIDAKKAAELYDVDEDLLADQPNAVLSPLLPEDRAVMAATIVRCQKERTPMRFVGRYRRRDGQIRWLETHANTAPTAAGAPLGHGQVRDVTGRKQLEQPPAAPEEARAHAEALHRQIIDALPAGVVVVNQALEFELMNPTLQRAIGGIVE